MKTDTRQLYIHHTTAYSTDCQTAGLCGAVVANACTDGVHVGGVFFCWENALRKFILRCSSREQDFLGGVTGVG